MLKSNRIYLFAISAVLAIGAVYFAIDPGQYTWMPKCIFHHLTGWKCPGCGSQRMLHALLHGDIASAWHHNALFVAILPILIPMGWLEIRRKAHPKLYAVMHSLPVVITLAAALLIWGILRNL